MIRSLAVAALGLGLAGCSYLPDFGRGDHPPAHPGHHAAGYGQAAAPAKPARNVILDLEATHEGKSSSDYHGGLVVPGALVIENRDFGDTHENARRIALRGSTSLSAKTEVFGGVSYTTADSRGPIQVGAIGVDTIHAEFGDYERLGLEIGARRYIDGATHPGLYSRVLRGFVSGSVGVAKVEAMDATFTSAGFPNLDPTLPTAIPANFYDESYVGTAFVGGGFQYGITPRAAIEFETGVRYDTQLNDDDTTLGALSLQSINDTDGRVVVPVTVRGRLRF